MILIEIRITDDARVIRLYLKAGITEGEFQNRVMYPSGSLTPKKLSIRLFNVPVIE